MKNRRNLLGILVMVLVFGITVVGCDPDNGFKGDTALNGTWVLDNNPSGYNILFNNGNYETWYTNYPNVNGNLLCAKGIYSTDSNKITMPSTHLYGSYLNLEYSSYINNGMITPLEQRWYTKNELANFENQTKSIGLGATYMISFIGIPQTYSIIGNKLTFSLGTLGSSSYTRK